MMISKHVILHNCDLAAACDRAAAVTVTTVLTGSMPTTSRGQ